MRLFWDIREAPCQTRRSLSRRKGRIRHGGGVVEAPDAASRGGLSNLGKRGLRRHTKAVGDTLATTVSQRRKGMTEQRVQRRLAAIMSADVVGYSRLMGADETEH